MEELDFNLEFDGIPRNPYAEECVIGLLLKHPQRAAELFGKLHPLDFELPTSQLVWAAAMLVYQKGLPVTPANLYARLEAMKVAQYFEEAGGMEYLQGLVECVPDEAFIPHYIQVMENVAYRRKIVTGMQEMIDLAAHHRTPRQALDERILALLNELQKRPMLQRPPRLNFTAAEFAAAASPEPCWLVPNLLLQGGLNLLAGEVSSGKTFLALDLAVAVASGGVPWRPSVLPLLPLGEVRDEGERGTASCEVQEQNCVEVHPTNFELQQQHGVEPHPTNCGQQGQSRREDTSGPSAGVSCRETRQDLEPHPTNCGERDEGASPVLYFCLDTSRQTLQRRLAGLCLGRGIDPPENLHFDLSPLDLSQPQAFAALKNMAVEKGAGLVILDALARYLPNVDENNVSSISPVLTGLRAITAETGITILILHHLNKGAGYAQKAPSALRIRGSSDILAAVDTALVCTGCHATLPPCQIQAGLRKAGRTLGVWQGGGSSRTGIMPGPAASVHSLASRTGIARGDATARRLIPVKNREQPESPPTAFRILPGDAGGVCIHFDPGDPGLLYNSTVLPAPNLEEAVLAYLEGHPGQAFTRSQIRQQLRESGIDASRRAVTAAFTAIAAHPAIQVKRRANTYSYTWVGER